MSGAITTLMSLVMTSTIVSVPIDLSAEPDLGSLEEKGVRAIYTSVERLQETDDGKVDWWSV